MNYRIIDSRSNELRDFFMRDRGRYLYQLGDMEEPYVEHCTYSVAETNGDIATVALTFTDGDRAALLVDGEEDGLLGAIKVLNLPQRVAFHMPEPLFMRFSAHALIEWLEPHMRMVRPLAEKAVAESPPEIRLLDERDFPEARRLTRAVFDIDLNHTLFRLGRFVGGFSEAGRLIAVASTHVYSPRAGVAAIGNLAVDPAFRNKKWGQKVMDAMLYMLQGKVDLVGLNVVSDNAPALALYRRSHFAPHFTLAHGIAHPFL